MDEQEFLTMPGVRLFTWCGNDYSMPLKAAGTGHQLEEMWDKKRGLEKRKAEGRFFSKEDEASFQLQLAFERRTTLKGQLSRMERHVQMGLERAEQDLEEKRNRLKARILQEEADLTKEYVRRAQERSEEIYREKVQLAEEILRRQKMEKEQMIQEKKKQQEQSNAEEDRLKNSLIKRLETAEAQKYQIEEKRNRMFREKEFDTLWVDLQKKRDEEQLKYEEEEKRLRLFRIEQQKEVLDKQIEGKRMMEEELKSIREKEMSILKEMQRRIEEEDEKEREFSYFKKLELKKDREGQLEEYRRLRKDRERREKELDDHYMRLAEEAMCKEQQAVRDLRGDRRREAEAFKDYLKELKAAEAQLERDVEEMRAQEARAKDQLILQEKLLRRQEKDKVQRDTVETWKHQVLDKQRRLAAEREAEQEFLKQSPHFLDFNTKYDYINRNKKDGEKVRIKDGEWQQKYEELLKQKQLASV